MEPANEFRVLLGQLFERAVGERNNSLCIVIKFVIGRAGGPVHRVGDEWVEAQPIEIGNERLECRRCIVIRTRSVPTFLRTNRLGVGSACM